jgi:RNA polymerase sigma-70 factor (ECF subfamily)
MPGKKTDNDFREQELCLWESFRKGDPDAFVRLYNQYVDVLYAFGTNFTNDKELIKDCIHDLFLVLARLRGRLSGTTNVRFYLLASLKRKILKEQTKRGAIRSFDPAVLPLVNKEESPAIEYVFIRDEEADHQSRILLGALKTLSDHQQKILFLRFNQELSYPEIADLLHISVESVRTMVYRSLKSLRADLREADFTFPTLFFLFRHF